MCGKVVEDRCSGMIFFKVEPCAGKIKGERQNTHACNHTHTNKHTPLQNRQKGTQVQWST